MDHVKFKYFEQTVKPILFDCAIVELGPLEAKNVFGLVPCNGHAALAHLRPVRSHQLVGPLHWTCTVQGRDGGVVCLRGQSV